MCNYFSLSQNSLQTVEWKYQKSQLIQIKLCLIFICEPPVHIFLHHINTRVILYEAQISSDEVASN